MQGIKSSFGSNTNNWSKMCLDIASKKAYNLRQYMMSNSSGFHSNRKLSTFKTEITSNSSSKVISFDHTLTDTMEFLPIMSFTPKGISNILEAFGEICSYIRADGFYATWTEIKPFDQQPTVSQCYNLLLPLVMLSRYLTSTDLSEDELRDMKPKMNSLQDELRLVLQDNSMILAKDLNVYYGARTVVKLINNLEPMPSIGKPLTEGYLPVKYKVESTTVEEQVHGYLVANDVLAESLKAQISLIEDEIKKSLRFKSLIMTMETPRARDLNGVILTQGKFEQIAFECTVKQSTSVYLPDDKTPLTSGNINDLISTKIFTTNYIEGVRPIPINKEIGEVNMTNENIRDTRLRNGVISITVEKSGSEKGKHRTSDNFIHSILNKTYCVDYEGNPIRLQPHVESALLEHGYNWYTMPINLNYDGDPRFENEAYLYTRARMWLKFCRAKELCSIVAAHIKRWFSTQITDLWPIIEPLMRNLRRAITTCDGTYLDPLKASEFTNKHLSVDGRMILEQGINADINKPFSIVYKYNYIVGRFNSGEVNFFNLVDMMQYLKIKVSVRDNFS